VIIFKQNQRCIYQVSPVDLQYPHKKMYTWLFFGPFCMASYGTTPPPPFLTLRISHKSYRKKSAYSSMSLLSFDVWRIYERVYLEWYMCVEGYKNVSLFPASHCYFFVSVPSYNVPFFFPVKLLNNN
jgi:hypothetical protein